MRDTGGSQKQLNRPSLTVGSPLKQLELNRIVVSLFQISDLASAFLRPMKRVSATVSEIRHYHCSAKIRSNKFTLPLLSYICCKSVCQMWIQMQVSTFSVSFHVRPNRQRERKIDCSQSNTMRRSTISSR